MQSALRFVGNGVGLVTVLGLALAPGVALAGQIYGQITQNNRPVVNGGPIKLDCGNSSKHPEVRTDRFGSYKVYLKFEGRCHIVFTYAGKDLRHPVQSSKAPARYNFEIRGKSRNDYKLQRR